MSALIVCASVSPYGNTRRVGQAMAPVLGAQITAPEAVTAGEVAAHQLAGFGSGIYSFTYHPPLWRLAAALRPAPGAAAFVFSTSGGPAALFWPSTQLLAALLARRGYQILGSFSCRRAYDWGILGPACRQPGTPGHKRPKHSPGTSHRMACPGAALAPTAGHLPNHGHDDSGQAQLQAWSRARARAGGNGPDHQGPNDVSCPVKAITAVTPAAPRRGQPGSGILLRLGRGQDRHRTELVH